MHASLALLLLALSALTLAAPAPALHPTSPSGVDITVYASKGCRGTKHFRPNMLYDDPVPAQDRFQMMSYKLSKDLGANDYMTFGSARPFVVKGEAAKKGCHDLKDGAFFYLFQKVRY